jgi:DNA-binding NarL/FixJ family response regulator
VRRVTLNRNRPTAQIAFRAVNAAAAARVLLAEPDQPTRAGLRLVLEAGGFAVAGEAADAATAVAVAVDVRPEVGLVAAELPGGGLDAIRQIALAVPRTRLIVLSGRASGEELVEAVRAGAVGYLGRETRSERLPEILRGILAGEVALPRRHSQHLVEALRGRDTQRAQLSARTDAALTDRQWEVLELLADGLSTAEIGHRLGISVVTTRRHISSVMAKLGVADRASAAELVRRRSTG